jgi:hypothetical protein
VALLPIVVRLRSGFGKQGLTGRSAADRGISNDLQASPNTALRVRCERAAFGAEKTGNYRRGSSTDALRSCCDAANGFVLHLHNLSSQIA